MKNFIKYSVFALIVVLIATVFNLDGWAKTIISKSTFIGLSAVDKFLSSSDENKLQNWTGKKLKKTISKLPKYIILGLA